MADGHHFDICSMQYPNNHLTDLARSANLPEELYILLALISSFLIWAKLSQYLLDGFSRSFHQMEGIWVSFLDQIQFFRFLKGRCRGNQFCGKIGAKLPPPCTHRSVIPKMNGISPCEYAHLKLR